MVAFFKKPYRVKRYSQNIVVDGYIASGYAEIDPVLLDVQEDTKRSSADEFGKRATSNIRAFGQFPFRPAESPNTKGDLILYKDQWYECVSCAERRNTLLRHYDSSFTLKPDGGVVGEL